MSDEMYHAGLSALSFGNAVASIMLACVLAGWFLVARNASYIRTIAIGLVLLALGHVTMGLGRYYSGLVVSLATVAFFSLSFSLLRLGMLQYVGRNGLGIADVGSLLVLVASIAICLIGYDGAAMALSFASSIFLLLDTGRIFWGHRREVPYMMAATTYLASACSVMFICRTLVLVLDRQWVIGSSPDNWAEDLTVVFSLPMIVAFGPMMVAMDHVRDKIALISETLTDPLTNLMNRRALWKLHGENRLGPQTAIAMFDLDHFKATNDVFGHAVGDLVLQRFASVLRRHASKNHQAFRLGGEEIALVMPRIGQGEARRLVENIVVAFGAEVVPTPIKPLRSTVSAGVSFGGKEGPTLDDVLCRADAALYEAKRGGRNRVVVDGDRIEMPVRSVHELKIA